MSAVKILKVYGFIIFRRFYKKKIRTKATSERLDNCIQQGLVNYRAGRRLVIRKLRTQPSYLSRSLGVCTQQDYTVCAGVVVCAVCVCVHVHMRVCMCVCIYLPLHIQTEIKG